VELAETIGNTSVENNGFAAAGVGIQEIQSLLANGL
jgi:hypothetical protein